MIKKLALILVTFCITELSPGQTANPPVQEKTGTENKTSESGVSNSRAQEQRKPSLKSDNRSMALRYSSLFTRVLNLDAQQQEKVNQFSLARITAMQQLSDRSSRSGMMSEEEKQIRSQFVQEMDQILRPEQKIKWDQYRSQIRQRKDNLKNGQKNASSKSTNPSQNPVLLKEDDGFDD